MLFSEAWQHNILNNFFIADKLLSNTPISFEEIFKTKRL